MVDVTVTLFWIKTFGPVADDRMDGPTRIWVRGGEEGVPMYNESPRL